MLALLFESLFSNIGFKKYRKETKPEMLPGLRQLIEYNTFNRRKVSVS